MRLSKLHSRCSEEHFLAEYYRLRQKEARRWYSRLTLKQRVALHPLLLCAYKLVNRLHGFSCEVLNDKRQPADRPIIFAVTHVGKFDIELVSEAIRDHCTLLTSEFEHLQGAAYAPFLGLNGAIYFHQHVKADRRAAKEKMIAVLQQSGNLMYFPEGAWNLHPAKPVLPLYWGVIDVARQGGAVIVPVAAEQYGKRFKVNIGENFYVDGYPDTPEGKSAAIRDLRDTLATLKWEIWESESTVSRRDLTGTEWDDYIAARLAEWPYPDYTQEYVESLVYRPQER